MFLLGLVLTSFVLVSSEPSQCDSECTPSYTQCLKCGRWGVESPIPGSWAGSYVLKPTDKRITPLNTDHLDMSKQNTGLLGVIVPKKIKDHSVRLPTKQQLQNLENDILYDYLREIQNYE